MIGSHSKKRPDNLVIGRTYDEHILDQVELGFKDLMPMNLDEINIAKDIHPFVIFQGDRWETD